MALRMVHLLTSVVTNQGYVPTAFLISLNF